MLRFSLGGAAAAAALTLILGGCSGGGGSAAPDSSPAQSESVQGVATPNSVSVVTAKNAN